MAFLNGPTVCGFYDVFPESPLPGESAHMKGIDVLGGETVVGAAMPTKRPAGKLPYGPPLKNTGPKSAAGTVRRTTAGVKQTFGRTAGTLQRASAILAKHDKKVVKRKAQKTVIKGAIEVGAMKPPVLSAKQRAAVQKYDRVARQSDATAKKLDRKAKTALVQTKKTVDAIKAQASKIKALRSGKTKVRGDEFEEIGRAHV